jgi:aminocarboxymuconate-semialdehyde decarboxylase
MAVDVQNHLYTPSLVEAATAAPAGSTGAILANVHRMYGDAMTDLESRLPDMDEAGVELSILSVTGLEPFYVDDRNATIDLIRRCNEELVEAAETHPDRFAALIALPFPYVDDCLDELQRLEKHPLVRGVITSASTSPWTLDEQRLEPVFAELARLGLPVLLHPAMGELQQLKAVRQWRLSASINAMVETSIAAARLMFSGMLDRVPDLTLIVPHLGGVLPYLTQRIVDQSGTGDAEHDLLHYMQNRVFFDTCSFYHPALRCAVDTVTADRILLGSDYPIRGTLTRAVADIISSDLTEAEKSAILHGNAARIGLGATAAAA